MAVELRGLKIDSFQCRNHPEREGVGICVSCRRVFCVECSTKIDGVNHCRECLAKRGATADGNARERSGLVARAIDSLFAVILIFVSVAVVAGMLVLYGDARAHGTAGRVANRDRMQSIVEGLRQYKRDTKAFPPGETATLRSLVVEPSGVKGWKGPYLDMTPSNVEHGVPDGYGTPVRYWLASDGNTCAIGSSGADRVFESKLEGAVPLKVGNGLEAEAQGDDVVLVVD